MKLILRNVQGESVGSVEVREDVFDRPMNHALVHQVVVGQLANARQGTASTKTRAEVSGGGAKPRPQKHTGNARQGSTRSPQWSGGGIAFGPKPRSYRHRTTKRARRRALVAALSEKVRDGQLVVVDKLDLEQPKTREMAQALEALGAGPSVLLVADGADPLVLRSAKNISRLKMLPASLLNCLDILNHSRIVMTVEAVRRVEELWGGRFLRRKNKLPVAAGGA